MHEKTFRFDIQSLRAVSVILVIFYHFNFTYQNIPLFSGGFIGVDIFFYNFRLCYFKFNFGGVRTKK